MKEWNLKWMMVQEMMEGIRNTMSVTAVWVLSTMMTVVLGDMQIRTENLLLIYLLGVIVCSMETRSMAWSIGSSILFLFTFNFLFTAPKYTFQMDDPNDMIALAIFIIVAFIAASLTLKLRRQTDIANVRADITAKLNEIGIGFLNVSGIPALETYAKEKLEELTGKKVEVCIRGKSNQEFADSVAEWCYVNSMECGHGKPQFSEAAKLYLPIRNSRRTYGVVIFDCGEGTLEREERTYVDMVITQITIVLQREQLGEAQDRAKIQIEKERLKSTLLRSISHDLRTPLTGIAGNADFLTHNLDLVDKGTVKEMLHGICKDAEWLNSMVENLLNMTRIQEGRLDIHRKMEVVDDLITEAAGLVEKRLGDHQLETRMPQEIVLVPVDGRLFIQVLVNLIDNALHHSGDGTKITVSAKDEKETVCFLVEDNGVGIPEEKQEQIFDSFFTTAYEDGDKKRGVGLGLAICKAIVEAHSGQIGVYNRKRGGAAFRIDMPKQLPEKEER